MRILAVTAALLTAGGAAAYSIGTTPSGFIIKWKPANVAYKLNPAGSDDVSNGSDLQAVAAAFADWKNVGCSSLTFQDQGDTSTKVIIPNGAEPNGVNELVWVEDSSWQFGQYTLGITAPITYTNGSIVEADIGFNGYLNQWSTTGQFGKADVRSVAIHEIGHMFGAQHNLAGNSWQEPPTMAPTADPYGKTASLESDDKDVICFLYPASGSYSCGSDDDCPFVLDTNPDTGQEFYSDKLVCQGGLCAFTDGGPVLGTKELGEECFTQTDCKDPFFCQPLNDGTAYCSQFCEPAQQNCPGGFACFGYQDSDGGACLPVEEQLLGLGEACFSSNACESGLCFPSALGTWECRQPCSGDGCPAGQQCFQMPGMPQSGCLPDELIPSFEVQDGDPCNIDSDCDSGICVLNPGSGGPKFCRGACNPAADTCSFGFECAAIGPTGGACVPASEGPDPDPDPPGLAAEGEACSSGAECETSMCFGGVCKRSCNVVSPTCSGEAEACQRITDDVLAGVCELRGTVPLGHPCNSDPDCWSRYCVQPSGVGGSRCLEPCPAGGEGCGDNRLCVTVPALTLLGACVDSDGDDIAGTDGGADAGNATPAPPIVTTRRSGGCSAGLGLPGGAPVFALVLLCAARVRRRRAGA